MHRMSGCDAVYIYDEHPHEFQHTLKVAIWSPPASARYSLEQTRRLVAARLVALPPLRWRAVRVPLDLHHPVWVDDPELDLERHVKRLAIPAPGGHRELCEVISEITSHPLDPDRPLWELWMLEGYRGDRVVAVLKMSHALADGVASRRLIEGLYAEESVDSVSALPAPPCGERLPSKWTLLRDGLRDRLCDPFVYLPSLLRALRKLPRRAREARRRGGVGGLRATVFGSPSTPLGGPLSSRRTFEFATLPLDEAKAIRRALGCTINDLVMGLAAGATRRYLRSRGALPGLPTLAIMPVSIRDDDERDAWGNRITMRLMDFPTHIEDPVERLRAAARIAAEAKRDVAVHRGTNLEDWLRWLPPSVPKLLSRMARLVVRVRPELPGGVCVSNVRGPESLLHTIGGPVENFVSVGHMKFMAGLNMTVWSYAGNLNVGLYGCAEAVPDLWRFAEFAVEAFEELSKAAAHEAARIAA